MKGDIVDEEVMALQDVSAQAFPRDNLKPSIQPANDHRSGVGIEHDRVLRC